MLKIAKLGPLRRCSWSHLPNNLVFLRFLDGQILEHLQERSAKFLLIDIPGDNSSHEKHPTPLSRVSSDATPGPSPAKKKNLTPFWEMACYRSTDFFIQIRLPFFKGRKVVYLTCFFAWSPKVVQQVNGFFFRSLLVVFSSLKKNLSCCFPATFQSGAWKTPCKLATLKAGASDEVSSLRFWVLGVSVATTTEPIKRRLGTIFFWEPFFLGIKE